MAESIRISLVTDEAITRRQMIDYMTLSILATSTRTWILAFVLYASLIRRTISIQNAFRSASFVRISKVFRQTLARSCTVLFTTNSIWATWARVAWVYILRFRVSLYWTITEWISGMTSCTNACRSVTYNVTFSVCATESRARIFTFLVNAGQVACTLWTGDALGSTVWRGSYKFGQTGAWGWVSNDFAFWVGTARRWLTRIFLWFIENRLN